MKNQNKQIENIFKAKEKRRKKLAAFPVEEKLKILIKLQKIASSVLKTRGIEKKPWACF